MSSINYQKELDKILSALDGQKPTLLLHSCCAPCSSYVLEYLTQYFEITLFYYNPNIAPEAEYLHRVAEQKRLVAMFPSVRFVEGAYEPSCFYDLAKGLEQEPEGGARCDKCYAFRLREAALKAKELGCDYFTTTLTVSPYKNAQELNAIGRQMEQEYGVRYLYSDFKKKEGYKRSIELSKIYNLYRQEYCGCIFSKKDSSPLENEK